jgi:hypothetical protein
MGTCLLCLLCTLSIQLYKALPTSGPGEPPARLGHEHGLNLTIMVRWHYMRMVHNRLCAAVCILHIPAYKVHLRVHMTVFRRNGSTEHHPTPHLTRRRFLALGGRRNGQTGLSTLRGVGGRRDQGRYARASQIPYPQPIPAPNRHEQQLTCRLY